MAKSGATSRSGRMGDGCEAKPGQLEVFGPGTGINTDLVKKYSKRAGSLPGNGPMPRRTDIRGKGPEGKVGPKGQVP